MRLSCPECNAEIIADKINVQEMVAVCSQCNLIFHFDGADARRKHRKVRKPPDMTMVESPDRLVMGYQRVYNEGERGIATVNGLFAILLTMIVILALLDQSPVYIPIGAWGAISWYVQATLWFNRTTVVTDDNQIVVNNGPLPSFTGAKNVTLNRHDISEIICEETEESRKSASINRFYHIRARLLDGHKITILKAMPEEYALYIAQELNTLSAGQQESTISHLQDIFNNEEAINYGETEVAEIENKRRI